MPCLRLLVQLLAVYVGNLIAALTADVPDLRSGGTREGEFQPYEGQFDV